MKYMITTEELAWRKRKVVRMYVIAFALLCIMGIPAARANPKEYLFIGIGTGLICLAAAIFTIRRSLATLQRFPIWVTPESLTLPYQNNLLRVPYDAIESASIQDDIRRPLLTLRIKGFPKIVLGGYENMRELIQEIQEAKKKADPNKRVQTIDAKASQPDP